MELFLKETRSMLKEVVIRVGDWDSALPPLGEAPNNNKNGALGIAAFLNAGGRAESTWMGTS